MHDVTNMFSNLTLNSLGKFDSIKLSIIKHKDSCASQQGLAQLAPGIRATYVDKPMPLVLTYKIVYAESCKCVMPC